MTVFFIIGAAVSFLFLVVTKSDPGNMIAPVLAVIIPSVYIVYSVMNLAKFGINAIG